MKRWIKRILGAVFALTVLAGTVGWYLSRDGTQAVSFAGTAVTRGDLLITIEASGTLEPEEVVDVGAQVAGQIVSFGTDAEGRTIDYGSKVEKGQLLAQIDEALAHADVQETEAQVASAKAGVQRAEADVEQFKAKLAQSERDWQRAQKLGPSEALAQATYDAYQSEYEMAKANVAVGRAAVLQAKASLAQAETSLWRANRNLGYCTISSPVKGTIIDRRVNIGQTVVASVGWQALSTGSLFDAASRSWSFGPSINWPVFQSGRTLSTIELQKALQEQSVLTYRQTVLSAIQEVENSLIASAKEQEHHRSVEAAATASRKSVDLATQLYAEGHTDFLNVLTAQKALYSSEDALVQSNQTLATELIALYKALGGGWDVAEDGSKTD